jgi:hypothetical protein
MHFIRVHGISWDCKSCNFTGEDSCKHVFLVQWVPVQVLIFVAWFLVSYVHQHRWNSDHGAGSGPACSGVAVWHILFRSLTIMLQLYCACAAFWPCCATTQQWPIMFQTNQSAQHGTLIRTAWLDDYILAHPVALTRPYYIWMYYIVFLEHA